MGTLAALPLADQDGDCLQRLNKCRHLDVCNEVAYGSWCKKLYRGTYIRLTFG